MCIGDIVIGFLSTCLLNRFVDSCLPDTLSTFVANTSRIVAPSGKFSNTARISAIVFTTSSPSALNKATMLSK